MRVKSIVIDGFKSYAHRKELADLSPHFNAITGLNGSGKSNIFDAICFVMGITNLKRMRAEDPRELIFRAGTTGVHAARVTIEFLNDDPATAPPGYSCEDFPVITVGRQIKLGGKQQFFFNNTVSMQSKVKRFFESISLNVDNPHFMVLQGTVHKLIGMRSQDILSLIEEAVGTKAFDHRRRSAEALIRNKEKKIEEIDGNIETQIGPMLEAMRADQEEYRRFLQMSEGLADLQRFRVAYEYHGRRQQLTERESAIASRKADAAEAKAKLQDIPAQEDDLTRRLIRLQDSLGAPAEAAIALHEEEGELKKQLSRAQTQLETSEKAVKRLEAALKTIHADQAKHAKGLSAFQSKRAEHDQLLHHIEEAKEKVGKLKQAMQLAQSGVRAGASGVSLDEERREVELRLIQHTAAIRRGKEALSDLTTQLEQAQRSRAQQLSKVTKLESEWKAAVSVYEREQQRYAPLAPLETRQQTLEEELSAARREYQQAYEALQREMGSRSFDLDFDRRGARADIDAHIRGRVGELVVPKEKQYATALLVGAQQHLLRVVVDSDAVAEDIIRHGLRQRTSFIALNKLQRPRLIEPAKVQEAQRIAQRLGGFVCVASSLVALKGDGADGALSQLAESLFGNFFVCSTLQLAQELAYNPAVRVKAVSLDGEVAEPNGLITGGSTQQLRDVFAELDAFNARKAPLAALTRRVKSLEQEQATLHDQLRQHTQVIKAYKAAEETAELARQRYTLAQENSKSSITELEEQLRGQRSELERLEGDVAQLKARKADIDAAAAEDPDRARKGLQKELTDTEKQLAKLIADEERGAAEFERLEADTEQQAASLASKLRDAEDELAHQQQHKSSTAQELTTLKEKVKDVQGRRAQCEAQRQRIEQEVEETQGELTRLTETKAVLDNTVKNAEIDLKDLHKAAEELRRGLREDERKHGWIEAEQARFGDPDGPFYFNDAARTSSTLQRLREAEAQAAVMSKRMNKKASILYEDRRKEYDVLVQQREALGEDKEAIQSCILGIEQKKWRALDRMVGVVSSIFGKLFSTCLPGATAQLIEERDDSGHLSGLGVRVSFSGKPKESLSELSGGQRSLLALCLILAILRVRPAPIYILDEVDAALDPSHTQNIGRMLQLYFPKSQFLLVSLKDGMFNNANVLYHVRNTQGYSEVSRMEHKGASGTAGSGSSTAAAQGHVNGPQSEGSASAASGMRGVASAATVA